MPGHEHAHGELDTLHELAQHHPRLGSRMRKRRKGTHSGDPEMDEDAGDEDSLAMMVDHENEQSLGQLVLQVASRDTDGQDANSHSGSDEHCKQQQQEHGQQSTYLPPVRPSHHETTQAMRAPPPARSALHLGSTPPYITNVPWAEAALLALMLVNRQNVNAPAAGSNQVFAKHLLGLSNVKLYGSRAPERTVLQIMRRHIKHRAGTPTVALPHPAGLLAAGQRRLVAATDAQRIKPVSAELLNHEQQRFNLFLPLWLMQLHTPRLAGNLGTAIARRRSLDARAALT